MILDVVSHINWVDVLVYAGIAGSTWLLYFLFIRPFLHPLRNMPGTPYYPIVGNLRELMTGEAMECSIKYIEKYGPILRYYFFFGMERVLVADPGAIKHILVTNCKNYIKPPSRMLLMRQVLGEGLILSEGQKHAVHKRLMSPAFNHTSIKKMIPVFQSHGEKLATFWANQIKDGESSAETNIHIDLTRTTLDIIGLTAFSYEFNSLEEPNYPVSLAFARLLQGIGLNWRMALPFYAKLPFPEVVSMKRDVALMKDTVTGIIQARRKDVQQGTDLSAVTKDLLGMLMLARDETSGEGLSDTELMDEVMNIMLAGHETTSVAMSWCLLTLAQHQDIQQKVREEIHKVFPSEDDTVTWEKLEQLEYCGCVVKEVLRMFPPVPLTLRQSLNADHIGGYYIPKDTILLLSIGPMMRQSNLFPEPNAFKPERYHDQDANLNLYSFLPFLIGPRMCLGYKFALMEMRALMVTLLRRLRFEVIPGTEYKRKATLTMKPKSKGEHPNLRLKVFKVDV